MIDPGGGEGRREREIKAKGDKEVWRLRKKNGHHLRRAETKWTGGWINGADGQMVVTSASRYATQCARYGIRCSPWFISSRAEQSNEESEDEKGGGALSWWCRVVGREKRQQMTPPLSLSLLPLERQIKDSGRASRMRDDVQPTGKRREGTIRFVLRLFPSGGGPAVVQQTLCPFSRGVVGLESTQPLSFDWSTWAARACGATRELQLPPPSPPGRCKGTGGERER